MGRALQSRWMAQRPQRGEAPDHTPFRPTPDQMGHIVHISAGVPKHRDRNPPLLQPGNSGSADEVPVLGNLPADTLVKHDLTVDHLVQRFAVHPGQQNGCQTVLAKGNRRPDSGYSHRQFLGWVSIHRWPPQFHPYSSRRPAWRRSPPRSIPGRPQCSSVPADTAAPPG